MTQISALRLICCSSSLYPRHLSVSPSFLSNPRYLLNCHRSTHTAKSSSARRGRKPTSGGTHFHQRRSSTLTEEMRKNKSPLQMHEMEQKNGVEGFNKRRAEGRDKSDMPRNLQLKSRKLNPVNTICYVQILGTGMDTQDTSPSVFLFFDKQRFIFNAGEGLQRFCTEHKIKLSKVDHVFLTRVSSETAGGLPGLLLTLAGIGEEGMSVKIWGPSDLKYLVDAMKSFIPNAAMVHTHSFGEAQFTNGSKAFDFHLGCFINPIVLIDDEVVRLSAILLRPKCSRGSSMKPGDVAVVYTCELPEIKGKFDPEKAISLGLKRGPKYGELQLGNSVMSDHLNIMVHPTDVLGPSSPGPIFLIVDCPTPAHTEELFSAQSLHSYYVDSLDIRREGTKVVNCIIHLGPAFVTKKTDYVTWMRRFGKAQHIMAGHEMKNMKIPILQSSAKISSRLNYLCPQLFPVPSLQVEVRSSLTDPLASCEVHSSEFTNWVSAENLLKFILRPYPQLGLDRSAIPSSLNYAQTINELLSEIPEINDVSKNISQLWSNHTQGKDVVEEPWIKEASALLDASDIPACMDNVTRDDMEIVLLGTGSSQPSKYRNVSSIYVNLFSKGGLLLDCGEGTLAQLKRRYGVEDADKKVQALKCIWISHIHADHHTGLARILALRSQLLKDVPHEPLLVIGPRQLKRFLDAYSILEDLDMLFLDCRHTTKASWYDYDEKEKGENGAESQNLETNLFSQGTKMQSYWKRPGSPVDIAAIMPLLRRLKELLCEAGLEALCSVPVIHCPEAFAIVLNAAERLNREGKSVPGWKLVYSGDTRPCQSLLDASHNATILIHEATFEDSMGEEAVARNHSTTMEAIQMGSRAGAYRIILTHFSQRYPKIPVFDEAHMHNTCIAFDLMSVNLADLPLLPSLLPYLKSLFRNEMAVDESDEVSDLAASQH